MRIGERNFLGRVLHFIDNLAHAKDLERTGSVVEIGNQILRGAKLLPRSDHHSVLDSVNDDLRIDAFFLTQDLDGLIDASHFVLFSNCSGSLLPLELEVGFFNLREWNLNDLSRGRLEGDESVREACQRALPATLVLDRLVQHEFHLFAGETFEVFWFSELPFDAGRTDLQRIAVARHHILDVENGADLLGYEFAFLVRHAFRL